MAVSVYFYLLRFKRGGYYFGTTSEQRLAGIGLMSQPQGDFYEGEWIADRFDGIGVLIRPLKPSYLGEFVDGLFSGTGRIVGPNYSYLGQFKEGMKSGIGELITRQGVKVIGVFGNSQLHGFGEIYDPLHKLTLKGIFKEGALNGPAVKLSLDSKFVGSFSNGVKEGVGAVLANNGKIKSIATYSNDRQRGFCQTFESTETYEGYLVDGLRQGYGKTRSAQEVYVGYFDKHQRAGLGHLEAKAFQYTGSWKLGKFEGIGYMKFSNKDDSYFGGWKNGEKNGIGYEKVEGKEYLGGFKDGVKEGFAIVKIPNRDEKCVFFQNGKVVDVATEEECRQIRENKLNFKHFIETSNRRLREVSRDIEAENQLLKIDYELIDQTLEDERKKIAGKFDLIRNRFEVVRDKFDLIRGNLNQRVRKSGVRYDNRFIHSDEADRMKTFTIQYEELISDFGLPYEPYTESLLLNKQGFMDQSWISFDRDISHAANLNLATNHLLLSKSPRQHPDPTPQRIPKLKETAIVRDNYEAFSNKKLEDIFSLKIEDMGVICYDDYDPFGSDLYDLDPVYSQKIDNDPVGLRRADTESIEEYMDRLQHEATGSLLASHRRSSPGRPSSPASPSRASPRPRPAASTHPLEQPVHGASFAASRGDRAASNVSRFIDLIDSIEIDRDPIVSTKPKSRPPYKRQQALNSTNSDKLDWSLQEQTSKELRENELKFPPAETGMNDSWAPRASLSQAPPGSNPKAFVYPPLQAKQEALNQDPLDNASADEGIFENFSKGLSSNASQKKKLRAVYSIQKLNESLDQNEDVPPSNPTPNPTTGLSAPPQQPETAPKQPPTQQAASHSTHLSAKRDTYSSIEASPQVLPVEVGVQSNSPHPDSRNTTPQKEAPQPGSLAKPTPPNNFNSAQDEEKKLQEERIALEKVKVQLEIEMLQMQLENVRLEKDIYEKKLDPEKKSKQAEQLKEPIVGESDFVYKNDNLDVP